MMIIQKLEVERQRWGDQKGQLIGVATFASDQAEVKFVLDPQQIEQMFLVCADAIESTAKQAALSLTCNVIEQKKALSET